MTGIVKKDKINNDSKKHNEPNSMFIYDLNFYYLKSKYFVKETIFIDVNTKCDETGKSSKLPNVFQPQQTTATSKNQGSRSTATFTALPFKARYQRVTKKRPRSSAINTMSMLNTIYRTYL